jgi:hypothetical protein
MNKTSIQTAPQAAVPSLAAPAPASTPRATLLPRWANQVLKPVASLRLTVVLFAFSLALVFFGTLAQIDGGIWTVTYGYFRTWKIVWVPFQLLVEFGQVFFGVPRDLRVGGSFPFPGGYILGALLLANLLAAHLVRFKFTWKRAGILLIHSGLILLMLGELITGYFAVEGQMIIDQGETANFVTHNRWSELVVIDPSDPKTDDVVAVPGAMLRKGGLVRHADLPFDVEVVQYMVNSHLDSAKGIKDNPATAGAGLAEKAFEDPEISGTSGKQEVDTPAAYLTFKDKESGRPLGTYLLSIFLKPQPVIVGDKTYQVALRFKRTYKPYALTLHEFRFDRYPGTDEARNYSSRLRLVDSERGEDREVLIKMNDPLRYRGETLYQADFNHKTEKGTVLQVVENPGWLIPYVSCAMVSLGMAFHFGLHLNGFLRRRTAS